MRRGGSVTESHHCNCGYHELTHGGSSVDERRRNCPLDGITPRHCRRLCRSAGGDTAMISCQLTCSGPSILLVATAGLSALMACQASPSTGKREGGGNSGGTRGSGGAPIDAAAEAGNHSGTDGMRRGRIGWSQSAPQRAVPAPEVGARTPRSAVRGAVALVGAAGAAGARRCRRHHRRAGVGPAQARAAREAAAREWEPVLSAPLISLSGREWPQEDGGDGRGGGHGTKHQSSPS